MPRMLRLTLLAPAVLVDILDGRCVQSDEAHVPTLRWHEKIAELRSARDKG